VSSPGLAGSSTAALLTYSALSLSSAMAVHVSARGQAGSRTAALLTYSVSLSSAFAPPVQTGARGPWSPRGLALRGGGTGSPLDLWMRRERIGVYSPYHASALHASASSSRAGDPQGNRQNELQELLVACEVAFDPVNGRVEPGENEMAGVAMRLDKLTAEQLGVPQADLSATESILYTEVAAGDKYTMCIFTLPSGAKLPLHDHPDMTVFSKVLWGEMQVSLHLAPTPHTLNTKPHNPKPKTPTPG
jgi:hypothetical protein